MKKYGLTLLAITWTVIQLSAQALSGISTRWSDSFVEWELFAFSQDTTQPEETDSEAPDEEPVGEIKLRWLNLRDDWSEWDYNIGDERGTIKLKWKNDPTHWELRSYDGAVVTMRTAWSNDLTEWRVTDNTLSLTLRSRWTNQFDEWVVQDPSRGTFYLYTLRSGDPRDWAIEDDLDSSVSRQMKLALVFIAIFQSTPRQ